LPDQPDRPVRGPHVLVFRAAFVPAGESPPPEFSADLHPLHMPAKLDPESGAVTSEASPDFLSPLRAEWYPDEEEGTDGAQGFSDWDSDQPEANET